MENIEEQLQVLTRLIQKLYIEVNSLCEKDRNMARYHQNTKVLTLSTDPDYDELFSMVSTANDMKGVFAPLTYRETQILSYVADGNTNKQIAYMLGTSDQTIKNHISTILRKLKANDRAHAVAIAMCNGWLSMERKQEDMVAQHENDLEPLEVCLV